MSQPLPSTPPRFSFTGIPTALIPNDPEDVMEYADQFIDNELVNTIITESNMYTKYHNTFSSHDWCNI